MKALIWPILFLAGFGGVAAMQLVSGDEGTCGEPLLDTAAPEIPPAPSFEARTISGETVRFPDDFRGKTVLLNFWATWCPPCRAKVPDLVKTYNSYQGRGFEVLAVTLDGARRVSQDSVREFATSQNMKWSQVYDEAEAIATKYHVHAIPAAFLVDGDTGQVLAHGHDLHGQRLEDLLGKRLKNLP